MLIEVLIILSIIFLIICLVSIITSYFWARRQSYMYPKTMVGVENYKFFFQKIVDKEGNNSGFEALLRKYNVNDDRWSLPEDIGKFTLREVIYLLNNSFIKKEYPNGFLAININIKQLSDPRYEYFINWIKGEIYPMNVHIEFYIDPHKKIRIFTKLRLKRNLKLSKDLGVKVILEQIKPDKNYYNKVKNYLKYIAGIKIPLSKFQKIDKDAWFYKNIGDWVRLSQTNKITVDMTEIEELSHVELADKLEINHRQGYFIGIPDLMEK